jgi:uncharacterized protein
MVHITIYKNGLGEYTGFRTSGHASYAEYGQDIVCAAISVLTINTVNSVEKLTDCEFGFDKDEESGRMEFILEEQAPAEAKLLLSSMVLGLQGIQESYGKAYLSLNFKEV